jgi:hypothetical protein
MKEHLPWRIWKCCCGVLIKSWRWFDSPVANHRCEGWLFFRFWRLPLCMMYTFSRNNWYIFLTACITCIRAHRVIFVATYRVIKLWWNVRKFLSITQTVVVCKVVQLASNGRYLVQSTNGAIWRGFFTYFRCIHCAIKWLSPLGIKSIMYCDSYNTYD